MKSNLTTKTISLLLALIFVFSTIMSASLFAVTGNDENPAQTSASQITGSGGTSIFEDGRVNVSKTIEGTAKENEFIITLKVETTEEVKEEIDPVDTAVVIILDLSGSMCYNYSGSKTANVTEAERRIYIAKQAIIEFLASYVKDNAGGERWVSIVTFAQSASYFQGWINISDSSEYSTLIGKINGITNSPSGGTNIQQGLLYADNYYTSATRNAAVVDIASDYRFALLVTDGNPTYYGTIPSGDGSNTTVAVANATTTQAATLKGTVNKLFTIAIAVSGNTCYTATDEGYKCGSAEHTHRTPNQTSSCYNTTPICGNSNHKNAYNGNTNSNRHQLSCYTLTCAVTAHSHSNSCYKTYTIGEYLSEKIATPGDAYNADDENGLTLSFESIANIIALYAQAWTLRDPMGDNINFNNFVDENNSQINNVNAVYNASGYFVWDIKKDTPHSSSTVVDDVTTTIYTYTLRYKITLDTTAEGFVAGESYDTNGTTTIKYAILEGDEEFKEEDLIEEDLSFLPKVKGYSGSSYRFSKIGERDISLTGTEFTMYLGNKANPSWSQTAAVDSDGYVTFTNIPSGVGYLTVYESKAAPGYNASTQTFAVKVEYGVVSSTFGADASFPNFLIEKEYTVKYFFEQAYTSGNYAQNLTDYPNGTYSLIIGESKGVADHLLSSVPVSYVYDAAKTADVGKTSVDYDFGGVQEIQIYYSLTEPAAKTFDVKYFFETGYQTGAYIEDTSFALTDEIIRHGETATVALYMLSALGKTTPAGYEYNPEKTIAVGNTISAYSNPRTLELYYSATQPGAKTFTVEYYFETSYLSGVYNEDISKKLTPSIAWGESFDYENFYLETVPAGFTFNGVKTIEEGATVITFATASGTIKLYYSADKPADRTYTVEYYFQDSYGSTVYELDGSITKINQSIGYGETVTAAAHQITRANYFYDTTKTNTEGVVSLAYADAPGTLKLYYSAVKPDAKTFTVEYYFETLYLSGSYVINDGYTLTEQIAWGESFDYTDFYLGTIPAGFSFNSEKTIAEGATDTSFENNDTIKLYYSADKPANKTFTVEYYFETSYLSGIYNEDISKKLTPSIAWGESFNYTDFPLGTIPAGFSFNSEKTIAEDATDTSFENNDTIKLYYSADKPADKTFNVKYFFVDYDSAIFELNNGEFNKSLSIGYGESFSYEKYLLDPVPQGYEFSLYNTLNIGKISTSYENNTDIHILYTLLKPADRQFKVEYHFQTAYGSNDYVRIDSYTQTGLDIKYGTTVFAKDYKNITLKPSEAGYVYNQNMTEVLSSFASLAYDNVNTSNDTLIVYLNAPVPASKTFGVEYYFETSYLSNSYLHDSSADRSGLSIAYGTTVSAASYATSFDGYAYNAEVTILMKFSTLTYDNAPGVLKLYYRANEPARKFFNVTYYFQNPDNLDEYVLDSSKTINFMEIRYGETMDASRFTLLDVPSGYQYNSVKTKEMGYYETTFDNTIDLQLYYSLIDIPVKERYITIEYLFEAGYGSGHFEINPSLTINDTIYEGETLNAVDYLLTTIPEGFFYNQDRTVNGDNASITFEEAPGALRVYYSVNTPEAKTFDVHYFFETYYGSGVYVMNSAVSKLNNPIAYGETFTVEDFPATFDGYGYNAEKTVQMSRTETTYQDNLPLELYYDADEPVIKTFVVEYYFETSYGSGAYELGATYTRTETITFNQTVTVETYKNINAPEGFEFNTEKTNEEGAVSLTYDEAPGTLKLYYSSTEKPEDIYTYTVVLHYTVYDNDLVYMSSTRTLPEFMSYLGENVAIDADAYLNFEDLIYEFTDGITSFVMTEDENGKQLDLYYEIRFYDNEETSDPLADVSDDEETSVPNSESSTPAGESSGTPKTGDNTSKLALYFSLAIFSAMGLAVLTVRDKKQKESKE